MQIAIRVLTKVQEDGKIEIRNSRLPAGKDVEVIVLLSTPVDEPQYSVLEVLASAIGKRLFKTPEDVEEYIHNERDAWEM